MLHNPGLGTTKPTIGGNLEDRMTMWQGRRVLLTGHTGFKGGWLALWLSRLGAKVRGYSLDPSTEPNMFTLAAVRKVVEDTRGDVRDSANLENSMRDFAPEVVFHLAAQPIVRRSYADPVGTYTTNVLGTVHVLEAVRRTPSVRAVVCITTDKVYQNQEWVWPYRETDVLGGYDPYASSKACAEIITAAYRSSFFSYGRFHEQPVALATARAGNVIGGGDWTDRQLIPDTILALSHGRPVVLRHPEATRPWQHVLDCLSGYLALGEALHDDASRFANEWNFGPPDDHMQPVSRVAEMLAKHWGLAHTWERDPGQHPHEESDLSLNSQKANRELGWACRLSLDQALAWTASWYRSHADGARAQTLCEEQITRYMELS